jgi:hypothetical protein
MTQELPTAKIANLSRDWNALVNEVKAVKSSTNPHFKNRFAPLDAWLDEIHRLCPLHNFRFIESIVVRSHGEDIYQVHVAKLIHVDGEVMYSEYFISLIDKPQAMGSATTYARRYNIQTLLTCTGEDDDDGNNAQAVTTESRTTVPMGTRRKLA